MEKLCFPIWKMHIVCVTRALMELGRKSILGKKRLKLIVLLGKKNEGLKEAEKGNEGKIFPFGLLLSFFC